MLNRLSMFLGKFWGGHPSGQDAFASNPYRPSPQATRPEADQIRSDGYTAPYSGPNDLDDYGRETDEMRRAYRDFHRKEPAVRSALEGLVASLADCDVAVIPEDEDNAQDCRAAEFVQWTVDRSPHGWDGLIRNTALPALIDGWSVGEKTFRGTARARKWGGLWGLKHVKSKDTANLKLTLDAYRNVLGVVNMVRGMGSYAMDKVVLFTHADVYDNPFGASELRAAYRGCQLIENAYQLWTFALGAYSGPFLKGKFSKDERRIPMQKALKLARAGGFITIPKDDDLEVINLASAVSFDAFERKIDKLREEIYMTIRGAYLPFMQGTAGGGDVRGDSKTSKGAGSDPRERVLCKALGRCFTHQLCADLVYPNFGEGVGVPRIVLGGTDWAETQAQLDVAKSLLNDFKIPLSKQYLYRIGQTPPPSSPEDAVNPAAAPDPLAGIGGGGFSERVQFHGSPPRQGLVWNEQTKRWNRPDEQEPVQTGGEGPKAKQPPKDKDGASAPPTEVSTHGLADLPALKDHPEDLPAAQSFAIRLHHKVYSILYKADRATMFAMKVIPEILDEPDDLKKLGYNPGFSGTDHAGILDPVKAATGLSAHTAASIAVQVLSRAAVFAKSRLSGVRMSDGLDGGVDLIADLLDAISDEMGIEVTVDREVLAATLKKYAEGGAGAKLATFRRE
jgi:hypothetical protein